MSNVGLVESDAPTPTPGLFNVPGKSFGKTGLKIKRDFSVDVKNGITVMKERITASEAPRLGFDVIKINEIKTFSMTTK